MKCNKLNIGINVKGKLSIGAFDPKTNKLIWMGEASKQVKKNRTEKDQVDLVEVVQKLMNRYPIRQ